jgi:hypothetical protein
MAVTRSQTTEVALPLDQAFETCLEAPTAVRRASLKDTDEETHTITVKVPISFKSWGERVTLQLRPAGPDATTVEVTSTASFPLTMADYGKNAQNVQQIVDWLSERERSSTGA